MTVEIVFPAPVLGTVALVQRLHPLVWWIRPAMLMQLAQSTSGALVAADGEVWAALGFCPIPPERPGESLYEHWLQIAPEAASAAFPLRRLARLTKARLPDAGDVRIRALVAAGHAPGRRMAAGAGLTCVATDGDDEVWESGGGGARWAAS